MRNEDIRTANEILHTEKLKIFVEKEALKFSVNQCYPSAMCHEF